MKNLKALMAIIIAIATASAVFTACSKKAPEQETTTKETTVTTTAATTETTTEALTTEQATETTKKQQATQKQQTTKKATQTTNKSTTNKSTAQAASNQVKGLKVGANPSNAYELHISYSPVSGYSLYEVEIYKDGSILRRFFRGDCDFYELSVTPNTSYKVRVRAVKDMDNEKAISPAPWSAYVTGKTAVNKVNATPQQVMDEVNSYIKNTLGVDIDKTLRPDNAGWSGTVAGREQDRNSGYSAKSCKEQARLTLEDCDRVNGKGHMRAMYCYYEDEAFYVLYMMQ